MHTDTAEHQSELLNGYLGNSWQEIEQNMLNIHKASLYCVLPYV